MNTFDWIRTKKDEGLVDIYFDRDNVKRNQIKQHEIESTSFFKLHAYSGFSFIAERGIHNPYIRKALTNGMRFQIIVQNPWSVNAILMGLRKSDFESADQYNQYLDHKLSADKLIRAYEKGCWKSKIFDFCIEGYKQLVYDFPEQISLRVSDCDLSNSIFITDNCLLLEPYYNTIGNKERGLPLFELHFNKDSDLYKNTDAYFNDLWDKSFTYTFFKEKEELFRNRLFNYFSKMI